MKSLVIIPAYNEVLNIDNVVQDIVDNTNYDYVIIDDCSKDSTYLHCLKKNYNVLHLPINYGLSSGVQIGLKYAIEKGYTAVVQFDGDGQHVAKYLPQLFEGLKTNDIVIGSRFVTEKKPFNMRMIGSRVISNFIRLVTGKKINDPTSGMRAFGFDVMFEYAYGMNYPPEPDTLAYMLKKGKKVQEIQVEMRDREFGTSYLNAFSSIKYMVEMVISILFIQIFRKR